MLTFFSIPKPFRGHTAILQRNAIRSWTLLKPECEILLFGDEEGTAEMANQYGLRHIPKIECNEYGTPLISSAFEQARLLAMHNLMCYVNADIIFLSDFIKAIARIANLKRKFLMTGQRWDLDIHAQLEFELGWEEEARKLLSQSGKIHPKYGMDYFVFRKWACEKMPPFAVGRPVWDNWMIYQAKINGSDIIDATSVVTAIHQNHDYLHVPHRTGHKYEGPEAQRNRSLVGIETDSYDLKDANFKLTAHYLRPSRLPNLNDLPPSPPSKFGWPWTVESVQLPDLLQDDTHWPKLCIVTPSCNQAEFLEETIRSVLLQNYPDLEYIIIDGGSIDGSVELIEKYRPWLSKVHFGSEKEKSAAIAEGFTLADGDVLAVLNPGDIYPPNTLGNAAKFFVKGQKKTNIIMQNDPEVSVILPTYNRAQLIMRSIKSVLDQTYGNFELIVIDDGSTDDTERVMSSFVDKRVRYIRYEKNSGAAVARNVGVNSARGKYIAFQDSDDAWMPEKLEKQMKAFESAGSDLGVVYTDMLLVSENGLANYWQSPEIDSSDIVDKKRREYQVFNIGIQSVLIKKECFNKVGLFDERFPRFIDLELLIRLSKDYRFFHIKEPLVRYHINKGISSDEIAGCISRLLLLEKYFKYINENEDFIFNQLSLINGALSLHRNEKANLITQLQEAISRAQAAEQAVTERNDQIVGISTKLEQAVTERNDQIVGISTKLEQANSRSASLANEIAEMRRSIVWQLVMGYHNCFIERAFPQGSTQRKYYDHWLEQGRNVVKKKAETRPLQRP